MSLINDARANSATPVACLDPPVLFGPPTLTHPLASNHNLARRHRQVQAALGIPYDRHGTPSANKPTTSCFGLISGYSRLLPLVTVGTHCSALVFCIAVCPTLRPQDLGPGSSAYKQAVVASRSASWSALPKQVSLQALESLLAACTATGFTRTTSSKTYNE